ncbi:type II toxin-antitoxin system VapC family toxin [Blastococcus mobilis]|uniref:type II toxin-antitoxin system VapC family toxin n=1 Tax=Blastococcus mobilis TaxID=1938746 RepID=UPI000B78484B
MTGVVVDTSAIVAILTREPGHEWLSVRLSSATDRIIAAPIALELGIVLEARVPAAVGMARRALRDARIHIVPFDEGSSNARGPPGADSARGGIRPRSTSGTAASMPSPNRRAIRCCAWATTSPARTCR